MTKLIRTLLILISFILLVNVAFWALVSMQWSPVENEYSDGRIVHLGPVALVFGHGSWDTHNGVHQHWTDVQLSDGSLYRGATASLVDSLRADGSTWVWGTWCYSGDQEYMVKDYRTGEQRAWPSWVSRNERPGITVPVWTGLGFARFSAGETTVLDIPRVLRVGEANGQALTTTLLYWVQDSAPAPYNDVMRFTIDGALADSLLRAADMPGVVVHDTVLTHATERVVVPADISYVQGWINQGYTVVDVEEGYSTTYHLTKTELESKSYNLRFTDRGPRMDGLALSEELARQLLTAHVAADTYE